MTANNGWMRTNINFDLPGRTFTVGARTLAVLGLVPPDGKDRDDPEALAAWAVRVLGHFRPELDSAHTIIVGVGCSLGNMEWQFGVLHPSLPKSPQFRDWPSECLERCDVCKKPLEDKRFIKTVVHRPMDGVEEVEVCSRECLGGEDADKAKVVEAIEPFNPFRCEVCKVVKTSTRDRKVWNTVNGVRHEWSERACDDCTKLYAAG